MVKHYIKTKNDIYSIKGTNLLPNTEYQIENYTFPNSKNLYKLYGYPNGYRKDRFISEPYTKENKIMNTKTTINTSNFPFQVGDIVKCVDNSTSSFYSYPSLSLYNLYRVTEVNSLGQIKIENTDNKSRKPLNTFYKTNRFEMETPENFNIESFIDSLLKVYDSVTDTVESNSTFSSTSNSTSINEKLYVYCNCNELSGPYNNVEEVMKDFTPDHIKYVFKQAYTVETVKTVTTKELVPVTN